MKGQAVGVARTAPKTPKSQGAATPKTLQRPASQPARDIARKSARRRGADDTALTASWKTTEPDGLSPHVASQVALSADPQRSIRVRGAREHNLKDVDIDIPRDKLVVVTGLSGSGKSSLAFDTVFAEGQRKYIESLSAYARQFLDQMKKPDVDSIEGLPPTIAIEQRASGHNPRSTVATATEIYDFLRLLFARAGAPTCWAQSATGAARCGQPVEASSPAQIRAALEALPEGTKLMVLAPVVRDKKGFHRDVLEGLLKQGFIRARVGGEIVQLEDVLASGSENPLNVGRYAKTTIEALVDRITLRPDLGARLSESLETALRLGDGAVIIAEAQSDGTFQDRLFSERYACPLHPDHALSALEPRLFSFNSPAGACPTCHGLGVMLEFEPELLLQDEDLALGYGAVGAFKRNGPAGMFAGRWLRRFCKAYGYTMRTPLSVLDAKARRALLEGDNQGWEGVIPILKGWFEKTDSTKVKEFLHQFMRESECPSCGGDRLGDASLAVFLTSETPLPDEVVAQRAERHGFLQPKTRFNIADISGLSVGEARQVLSKLVLTQEQTHIAAPILRELESRLGFLESVGLEYLSLARRINSLSGGEAQRIRLATQVGSGIVGAAYVLDEPTIGLHPRDNDRLIRTLRRLTDIGNTVIVVEHDEEVIRASDYVIDVGPGPGIHGGNIVAAGPVATFETHPTSLTAAYLSGRTGVPMPSVRRSAAKRDFIELTGCSEHNLKDIDVRLPKGALTVVTGVSGSGKSTLVNDILLRAAKVSVNGARERPGAHRQVKGLASFERVIEVDQTPIGRTPRSNPATYTGIFDDIRKIFTQVPEARARGYQPGRFSFNVKGGRCEACQGQGLKRIEMHFLPDIFVQCEACGGTRYNRETLEVRYRGLSIADCLAQSIEDAKTFFENHPKIDRYVRALCDVGLGYLTLGQPSTTLSGGEAQRVKLATELGRGRSLNPGSVKSTLFVLDEPTTGLHFEDVRKLTVVLDQLVQQSHTVVVIEHNLDVIKCADWLIDLGPEGGSRGGEVLVSGTPEAVASHPASFTGQYLRQLFA